MVVGLALLLVTRKQSDRAAMSRHPAHTVFQRLASSFSPLAVMDVTPLGNSFNVQLRRMVEAPSYDISHFHHLGKWPRGIAAIRRASFPSWFEATRPHSRSEMTFVRARSRRKVVAFGLGVVLPQELDGRVVGLLEEVAVHPHNRGSGIGIRAARMVIEDLGERGCDVIWTAPLVGDRYDDRKRWLTDGVGFIETDIGLELIPQLIATL